MIRELKQFVVVSVLALSSVAASAMTVNFTSAEAPGVCNGCPVTTEYLPYGLTISDAYWYSDLRDTFDGQGLSINVTPTATIAFGTVTPSVDFEYWVIGGFRGHYEAFDSGMGSLGSLDVDASSGDVLGTFSFGGGVKYLTFSGERGFVQVSAVTYAVPEPGTYVLMLSGLAAMGLFLRRRRP